jgi:hypothetical protein
VDADALAEPEDDTGEEVEDALALLVLVWEVVLARGGAVVEPPVGTVSRGCRTVPLAPELPPPHAAIRAAQAAPATVAATTRAASPGRITPLMDPACPAVPSACRSACSR